MKLADALKRIEQLEARVRELEARPPQQVHYHYPAIAPLMPQPYQPLPTWIPPVTICGPAGNVPIISERDKMFWKNPAPDAACGGVPTGQFTTLTIGS